MDNVETGDEDVRKNLGAIPSAKAVNPHQQQQQQQWNAVDFYRIFRFAPAFRALGACVSIPFKNLVCRPDD